MGTDWENYLLFLLSRYAWGMYHYQGMFTWSKLELSLHDVDCCLNDQVSSQTPWLEWRRVASGPFP